ncbi:MAG: hypothetical protein IPH04_19600 [Saprospirales bacterium]|nr:hypothetical protein [Saprospirales bacterium]MBK6904948.1 hypothetical protein [Saprospirales bacterium]MBK7337625.1 hypothetical protein [Saprospirales bacterium]
MPIEIKELVIKAQVQQTLGGQKEEGISPQKWQKLKKEVVEECVEKIKEWLERKLER